ncbi:peptidoglycan-binding domain-containing protein [Kitasatospora sp. NPDC094016]|uniref:peptidoglycan-binding domain-containing protein n=1 Tax=unclassified Kitasatospora TaxID=2633591 RepID=UPI00332AA4C6
MRKGTSMRKILAGLAVTGLLFAGGVATAGSASAAQAGSYCGTTYTTWEPLLRGGENNDAVKALQCELNSSLNTTPLNVDGAFGQDTLSRVLRFQACTGLSQDGQVGAQTWAKLDSVSTSTNWAC